MEGCEQHGQWRGGMVIQFKHAYEPAGRSDRFRVLVDRLWPRGLSRERARVDRWVRARDRVRRTGEWFGHDPARWAESGRRYLDETPRAARGNSRSCGRCSGSTRGDISLRRPRRGAQRRRGPSGVPRGRRIAGEPVDRTRPGSGSIGVAETSRRKVWGFEWWRIETADAGLSPCTPSSPPPPRRRPTCTAGPASC